MYNSYFKQILLACGILLILTTSCHYDNKKKTSRNDKRNFSISDTSSISKIIIENRNLDKIILQRDPNKNNWILNDSLIARKDQVNRLLTTIKEMRIKQPIARSALNNVTTRMGIQNTKVSFFNTQKNIKTIYVGGETADQLGTFMMIHGATEPYIVHIPGFNGYLSSRFSCQERDWKNKKIFNNPIESIHYYIPTSNEIKVITADITQIQALQKIYCEDFVTKIPNLKEIQERQPFITITTKDINGDPQILHCIRKRPVNKLKYQHHKYDRERFYGKINNTIMLIQYSQFEPFINLNKMTNEFTPWKKNDKNIIQ